MIFYVPCAATEAEREYEMMAQWEEKWVRDGVADFEKLDEEVCMRACVS